MDVNRIIEKYYDRESKAYYLLTRHSRMVMEKALRIAGRVMELQPDLDLIKEAALLHDIGIFMTHSPDIGCYGFHPYIAHGYLGRELLEKEGLPRHALVCERHVGIGITREDIEARSLPLPLRDMAPVSLEEKIICFADKFYSKGEKTLTSEKPVPGIREMLSRFGGAGLKQFDEWLAFFREPQ